MESWQSAKPTPLRSRQVYDKLNAEVKDFSFTSQFLFELTVNLPGGGSANLTGKAGPINPQNSAMTPFDASMKVKNLGPRGLGLRRSRERHCWLRQS